MIRKTAGSVGAGLPAIARVLSRASPLLHATLCRLAVAVLMTALMAGCAAIRPKATPQPAFYALDSRPAALAPSPTRAAAVAPTLLVNPSHAVSGFDSQRIVYVRSAHRLEYFAHSEWIDTPARMLTPLIVAAVEAGGAFRAVVPTPGAAAGELRLDTEIVRLEHDFIAQPSRARFTLRAYIVDTATRRVVARREFDAVEPAASADPYGGVVAANRAVRTVLEQLVGFCAETAASWRSGA